MFICLIQASLTSGVKEATGMGFRLEVHAIGDAAADAVIKAFDDANVSPEKRPLLTHAQVCTIYLNFYKTNHSVGIFGTLKWKVRTQTHKSPKMPSGIQCSYGKYHLVISLILFPSHTKIVPTPYRTLRILSPPFNLPQT